MRVRLEPAPTTMDCWRVALSVDSSDGPLATTSTPLSATLPPLLTRRPAAPLPEVRMEPPDMFNELPPCKCTPCAFLPLV